MKKVLILGFAVAFAVTIAGDADAQRDPTARAQKTKGGQGGQKACPINTHRARCIAQNGGSCDPSTGRWRYGPGQTIVIADCFARGK